MALRVGLLPLARATFDVDFASESLDLMLKALGEAGLRLEGPRRLLMESGEAEEAIRELGRGGIDRLLVLQATFTDAEAVKSAAALDTPLSIWAVPEPRLGGRLRLNAFCGLNLAAHALGLAGKEFAWLYQKPRPGMGAEIEALLGARPAKAPAKPSPGPEPSAEARSIAAEIAKKRIACVGDHPPGFDTCAYSPERIARLAGVEVDRIELGGLFERAMAADPAEIAQIRAEAERELSGLGEVDQGQLDRSLRLKAGLESLRGEGGYDAFALRCWPEAFTEHGGAACGPAAMMGERKIPCACEADVYGALTQLILQEAAGAPVFLADIVDMDEEDGTGVVWHCGQAPASMKAPGHKAEATVHTNRKMPLLYEFPLKPGRVTLCRVSQARNEPKMALAGGEMLERPMAFTGTSGVVRFDRPAGDVARDLLDSGLEHHMALAYGECRPLLSEVASAMGLGILEL